MKFKIQKVEKEKAQSSFLTSSSSKYHLSWITSKAVGGFLWLLQLTLQHRMATLEIATHFITSVAAISTKMQSTKLDQYWNRTAMTSSSQRLALEVFLLAALR